MKRNLLMIGVSTLILMICNINDLQAADSKYRLGLQGTHFIGGLSGIVEISDPWALQGILDFGADAIGLRLLNRFTVEQYWNFYGEGTLAFWSHDHRTWGGWEHHDNDNNLGLGVGIGVEYDWRGLNPSLPPIGWNIEIGANVVPGFDLALGFGAHWKF